MMLFDSPSPQPPAASNGLDAGTLGYWNMDEVYSIGGNRADATGNGFTAVDRNTNIPSSSAIALINSSAVYPSGGSALDISPSMDSGTETSPFGVSIWIKRSLSWRQRLMARMTNSVNLGWIVTCTSTSGSSTTIGFQTTDDLSNISSTTSSSTIAVPAWNHLVFGFDGSKKYLYINGVLDPNFPVSVAGVSKPALNITIGNYSNIGASSSGAPYIDEVAYFNFMPSALQASLLYNSGAGLPYSQFS